MQVPIALPLEELVPGPELFVHASSLHGQAHVARVLVHAFRLVAATGRPDEVRRLWAAVYLHDLARTHDGRCQRHGEDAVRQFAPRPELRALFARGGVEAGDYEPIHTAVVFHSRPDGLDRRHPHWPLLALLKDADGLDRVRLGDLDPRYLRHPEARGMVGFAERLYAATDGRLPAGAAHFPALWAEAVRLDADGD
ncbi:MAG: hypothetical protein FJ265_02675 [Planctomycetes bacterium]|nr:hypothetical protein [Planctomycetota bacterium]